MLKYLLVLTAALALNAQNHRPVDVPRVGVSDKVLPTLPQSLQDQIAKYREQSKTFIDAQRELAKTVKTATEEQRNTIREQLKANRDKFLADTQQLRTEIRDQLKDLGVAVRGNKPEQGKQHVRG
jgi:uncharacterized coiled-coil DUF342 family protein